MNQGNICCYDTNIFESGLTTPLVLISIMFFCRFVDLLCTFMQFANLPICLFQLEIESERLVEYRRLSYE